MQDDLIFDIGMHDGTDSAFYLEKGFRVIGVEANPALCAAARLRFEKHIAANQMVVLNEALAPDSADKVTIYIATRRSDISTAVPDFAARNASFGERFETIEVVGVGLDRLMQRYGTPYYVKIDIEGLDTACLPALLRSGSRPRYVSLEADLGSATSCVETIDLLAQAGYRRFKVLNQLMNRKIKLPDPPREGRYVAVAFTGHTSGPFGEETPGPWLTAQAAAKRCERVRKICTLFGEHGRFGGTMLARYYSKYRYLRYRDPPGWYDIHAALP